MTTTTKTTKPSGAAVEEVPGKPDQEAADRLAGLLPAEELQKALEGLAPDEITGPGGLVTQLAGRVIETALGAELTEHLGYPPGQGLSGGAGNHRNGSTPKTVQTELGPVQVNTPWDRAGTFEPQLIGKRQTCLAGLDEKILDLYAGGMSVRDIEAHLQSLYDTKIGRDTISRVTDAVGSTGKQQSLLLHYSEIAKLLLVAELAPEGSTAVTSHARECPSSAIWTR